MIRIAAVALVVSVVLPAAAFTVYTTPFATFPPEPVLWIVRVIDFPIAAFNWVLPHPLKTHMTWSLQCGHTYCFPRPPLIERTHYQLVGTAAYLVLFAIGGLAFVGVRES